MDEDEKVKLHREIERQKALLRVEETFPAADECAACKTARAESGDPTFLCDEHLKRIYGL
ncbi:MAG: hypothetical protein JWN44_165 [Myxococcales bacterium]|nr:hypothetical protein [Myxococcales bacterium]